MRNKIYNLDIARQKIQRFCAYQERCHQEVEKKLSSFGLGEEARGQLILELIQENFLNEERFASAYVSGKFRIKKWGKKKIQLKLKEKAVSDYCINKAMAEIDEEEYLKTLEEVINYKWRQVKDKDAYKKKGKVANYAYSRGFESSLIWEILENLKGLE